MILGVILVLVGAVQLGVGIWAWDGACAERGTLLMLVGALMGNVNLLKRAVKRLVDRSCQQETGERYQHASPNGWRWWERR